MHVRAFNAAIRCFKGPEAATAFRKSKGRSMCAPHTRADMFSPFCIRLCATAAAPPMSNLVNLNLGSPWGQNNFKITIHTHFTGIHVHKIHLIFPDLLGVEGRTVFGLVLVPAKTLKQKLLP